MTMDGFNETSPEFTKYSIFVCESFLVIWSSDGLLTTRRDIEILIWKELMSECCKFDDIKY